MNMHALSDQEFSQFRQLIHDIAGISLSPLKKPLVCGRLAKRLTHHRSGSYGEYFKLLVSGDHPEELQMAVDLLTTNETYFFREPKHFDFLRDRILPSWNRMRTFRVWSAASSSGQEAYSIAMLLAEHLPDAPWEVLASDISSRVLDRAAAAIYPLEHASHIPPALLSRHCLKGVGSQEGNLRISPELRARVRFMQINLNHALPNVGDFDLIWLRNVMIYFDAPTKTQVVGRLLPRLKPDGHLFVGHSESLNGVVGGLRALAPSIYRKSA